MRLFVALALPEAVRKELSRIVGLIAPVNPGVRWVPEENYHLTLAFLGGVSDERVSDVVSALRSGVAGIVAGSARLDVLGAFPSARRARVLWVGLADAEGVIARLSTAVGEAVAALGFPREDRPFTPHVTVGRRKDAAPLRAPQPIPVAPMAVPVDRVTLYRSHLGRPSPRYEVVDAVGLRA